METQTVQNSPYGRFTLENNYKYEKRVECIIKWANLSNEIHDNKSNAVIHGGAQGESCAIIPGKPVLLKQKHLYCFSDAIVDKINVIRDERTGELIETQVDKNSRFNIEKKGYYISPNLGNNVIPKKEDCVKITETQFFDEEFNGLELETYYLKVKEEEKKAKETKDASGASKKTVQPHS